MEKKSSRRSFIHSAAIAVAATSLPLGTVRSSTIPKNTYDSKGKGLVVLFQGDSITDGKRGRNADLNHIMGHGYAFSIASRWGADFPSEDLLFYNRGVSGNTVLQLQDRWQTDCLDLQPNLLSILVGINDAAKFVETPSEKLLENYVQSFENTYRSLLQQVRDLDPKTLLVVCIPFISPVGKVKNNWNTYQDIVSKISLRIRNLAIEFDAVTVDFQKVFDQARKKAPDSYWIWDGIHPTVPGHELMAREWLKEVSKRLKFLKKYD